MSLFSYPFLSLYSTKLGKEAVAAAQRVAAMHSATAAERLQQRGCCGRRSAAVVSSATVGGCSVSGATKAQRSWRTARRRQRGGSSAEAAADSPAPSANGPTQVPSNATDSPTYASSSLVEDGGTTASTASSSSPRRRRPWRRPLQSPMRRRCR